MTIYYCLNKVTKKPESSGRVPEVWRNISGLSGVSGSSLSDLTWAGHPEYGFLTEEQALECGASEEDLKVSREFSSKIDGDVLRRRRDLLLADCDWVVVKAYETKSEVSEEWSAYRKALREITQQPNFPWDVEWPNQPI